VGVPVTFVLKLPRSASLVCRESITSLIFVCNTSGLFTNSELKKSCLVFFLWRVELG
jgi:hypothetical protein